MLKTRWTSKIHFYKVEGKMKKKKENQAFLRVSILFSKKLSASNS